MVNGPFTMDQRRPLCLRRFDRCGNRDRYPAGTPSSQQWADWMPFLAHRKFLFFCSSSSLCVFFGSLKDAAGPDRVPGDSIYLGGPRPVEEYKALAASGAKWMGMGVSCALSHSGIFKTR